MNPPANQEIELTVVMPCLNEAETLETCVRKALQAMSEQGITGEVLVADNGSTDGSIEIARRAGAGVTPVQAKGYGNALMGGIAAASGFGPMDYSHNMRWVIPGTTLTALGFQTVLSSFFVSILGMKRL